MADWVAGAEVISRSSGWGSTRYGSIHKIGKVYANGNFVLEGDDTRQQWRVGSNYASQTRGGIRSNHLVLVTPELEIEIERSNRVSAARNKLSRHADEMAKLARQGSDDEILAAVAALP